MYSKFCILNQILLGVKDDITKWVSFQERKISIYEYEIFDFGKIMNDLIQLILSRRSIRKFKQTPISKKDLELIVEAGLAAPSGKNQQTWKFTVITSTLEIQKLADAIGKVLSRENYNFYKPTALIIPSNLKESPWGRDDNACALQNIFLAAHSLQIGSVWINQLKDICDHELIRPILDSFEIPKNHVVYGLAALGYPETEVKQIERKGLIHFVE